MPRKLSSFLVDAKPEASGASLAKHHDKELRALKRPAPDTQVVPFCTVCFLYFGQSMGWAEGNPQDPRWIMD